MSFTVRVRQADRPVSVEMGQTILEAALSEGIAYPHGCRSGNCGACKSHLLSGDVEMSPHSEYALTDEEKARGLILACRAVPWEDCEVEWLGEDEVVVHPVRHLACTVVDLEWATHDIRIVRLRIDSGGPFTFSAGQYASLRFGGLPPRDYSMANRPDEELLEFHVRKLGTGASAYVAERLQVGEEVRVEGPFGSSYLRDGHAGPILAIAGGSGLAPIRSIVETALHLGMPQPIHLYFGARQERDLYGEARFRELERRHPNFRFVPVLSEPDGSGARRTGLVGRVAAEDFPDLDGFKAYLAGPPVMVESTTPLLVERGIRPQDVHADAFYTEAEKARLEEPGARRAFG